MEKTKTVFVKFVNQNSFSPAAIDNLAKLAKEKKSEQVSGLLTPFYQELTNNFYTKEEADFVNKFCEAGVMTITGIGGHSILFATSGKTLTADHLDSKKMLDSANALLVENHEDPVEVLDIGFHYFDKDFGVLISIINTPIDSGICLAH